jgi:putative transposase
LVKLETETALSVKRRCELLKVARSTLYYKPKKNKGTLGFMNAEDKEARMRKIDEIHTARPATGARKMARELTDIEGLPTTRYAVRILMEEMNIRCIYPKPNLSKPAKGHVKFPYLLKNKDIWLPNQVWAIDITYLPFKGGHMYLTAIIDWYSRMIVGWSLADSLDNAPVLDCVKKAFVRYGIPSCQNSDQGSHFTSKAYVELLAANNVAQSMDGKARWVDNVVVERWFRTLKHEYVYINDFASPRELRLGIEEFINSYNNDRSHASLDYRTPSAVWSDVFSKAA